MKYGRGQTLIQAMLETTTECKQSIAVVWQH